MKTSIIVCLIIFHPFCYFSTTNLQGNQHCEMNQEDSIILIKLFDNVSFYWDNSTSRIVEDKHFKQVFDEFSINQKRIAALITDTTKTSAKICGSDKVKDNLLLGDLAFLLIDKIKKLPYAYVFNMQFDVLAADCEYPVGLYYYINNNRYQVMKKVSAYLDE